MMTGQVKQEGFTKMGNAGQMDSYDINGNKTAVAEYNKGKKVGSGFLE
jgi:hypothetical protein